MLPMRTTTFWRCDRFGDRSESCKDLNKDGQGQIEKLFMAGIFERLEVDHKLCHPNEKSRNLF